MVWLGRRPWRGDPPGLRVTAPTGHHAKSGDGVAIAAYLGSADVFDQAITQFAASYADQTEREHQALASAAATGRVIAQRGL